MIRKETVPRDSETNAIIERANRTILDMSRTAIIAAELPKSLWYKASDWAAYTKNRIPHKALGGKGPIEIFLQKVAVLQRQILRPFSQRVTCYNYEVTDKLSSRSYKARIIGYTATYGTYWVIDSPARTRIAKNAVLVILEDLSDSKEEENGGSCATEDPEAEPDIIG